LFIRTGEALGRKLLNAKTRTLDKDDPSVLESMTALALTISNRGRKSEERTMHVVLLICQFTDLPMCRLDIALVHAAEPDGSIAFSWLDGSIAFSWLDGSTFAAGLTVRLFSWCNRPIRLFHITFNACLDHQACPVTTLMLLASHGSLARGRSPTATH
jgi:hypothetical protein